MKYKVICLMLILVISSTLTFATANPMPTGLGGTLGSDTTWTSTQNAIRLSSDLIVPSGVTLTIEPGVHVDLWDCQLTIKGLLICKGTSDNQVIITTSIDKNSGLYANNPLPEQLHFASGSKGSILEYTKLTERIIVTDSITVSNSRLEDFLSLDKGDSILSDNYISYMSIFNGSTLLTNNQIDQLFAVEGTPTLRANTIKSLMASTGTFENNTLTGNTAISKPIAPHKPGVPVFVNNLVTGRMSASTECYVSNNRFTDGISISGAVTLANNDFAAAKNNTIISISGNGANVTNNQITGMNNYPFNLSKHEPPPKQIGISIDANTTGIISENHIERCQIGINILPSNTQITKNTINDNYCGITLASALTNSPFPNPPIYSGAANIQQNDIIGNSIGIDVWPFKEAANITNNNIQDNSPYNVRLNGSNDTNLALNWWGTTDIKVIQQSIYDGTKDPTLGTVTFSPFYTAPYDQSPSTAEASSNNTHEISPYILLALAAVICITILAVALKMRKRVR
jgi:hypothetical protein